MIVAVVKIVDGIDGWFIVKNSPNGINARKETALLVVIVFVLKNSFNTDVKELDRDLLENTGAGIINGALVGFLCNFSNQ